MDSNNAAVLCPVCFEVYNDPRSLPCGHSFCFKCILQVAGHRQQFHCPSCRANVKLNSQGVNRLPKNYSLAFITEQLLSTKCSEHTKPLDMFCAQCDVMICSKCLVRSHSGHQILETEEILNKRKERLKELLESTKSWQAEIKEKTDLIRLSRQSVQADVERINAEVDEKFRRWSVDLETQRQILRQYVSNTKQQRMNVFDLYQTVLDGINTEISSIQTEMNATLSKDTMSVMQLHKSVEKSHEKVGNKIKEVMADCFYLPKGVELDIDAPLMEKAIQTIRSLYHCEINQHRPSKIVEMFSETYDNEWTDAYEELENQLGSEKKVIFYLREILLEINSVCKYIYSSKLKTIEEAFVKPSVPSEETEALPEIFKSFKDGLKFMAPRHLEQIRKHVLESLKSKFSAEPEAGCLQSRYVEKYIIKCTEVCWYMSVQDPQLIMDGSKSPDGKFDANKHIPYTMNGPYEEFIVWPVLYLYQGGPVLKKRCGTGKKKTIVISATLRKNIIVHYAFLVSKDRYKFCSAFLLMILSKHITNLIEFAILDL